MELLAGWRCYYGVPRLIESTLYFEEYDEERNTVELLRFVREYAEKHRVRRVVVASTRGFVAKKALETLGPPEFDLVVVTHAYWFRRGVEQEFDPEIREELVERGVKIVTGTHALAGVPRATRNKYGGPTCADLIAGVLRMFCEGVKVCVEIAAMAVDAGAIPPGEEVISVAGTGRGADTALLLVPYPSHEFFSIRIRKVLAKPLYYPKR